LTPPPYVPPPNRQPPSSTLFPYTTLFRSCTMTARWPSTTARDGSTRGMATMAKTDTTANDHSDLAAKLEASDLAAKLEATEAKLDRKSTRLNSSHDQISYAVFCLKKKKNT